MKPAATVTFIVLLIVALMHLVRVIFSIPLIIGDNIVPVWPSVIGTIGPLALAFWLRSEQRKPKTP